MQDASILFLGDNSAQTVLWPKYKAANAVLKYDIVQVRFYYFVMEVFFLIDSRLPIMDDLLSAVGT